MPRKKREEDEELELNKDELNDEDEDLEDEEEDDNPDYEPEEDDNDDPDDENYNRIDRAELDAIFKDEEIKEESNADDKETEVESDDESEAPLPEHGDGASVTESEPASETSGLRRSERNVPRPVKYQAYQKTIKFKLDPRGEKKVEKQFNIKSGAKSNIKKVIAYTFDAAQVVAKVMTDIHG